MKQVYFIQFKENYDVDAIDEISQGFIEATPVYPENKVRFYGINERLQEFLRAVKAVGEDIEVV